MILWLILTIFIAAAAVYVAAAFLRNEPDPTKQARTEAERRVPTSDKIAAAETLAEPQGALDYKFALVVISACTIFGSAILYAYSGNPGLPSAVPMATDGTMQGGGNAAPSGAASPALADVDSMIGKLRERLQANPNDPKGWGMLGWSLMSTAKFNEAVDAYRKAVSLDGKSADLRVGLADALIQQAGGQVTAEAKSGIDLALTFNAKEPRALFLRGLGKSQGGDAKGAIEDWIGVLGLASPTDPWTGEVRGQIEALARQANIDVSGRLSASAQVTQAPAAVVADSAAPAGAPSLGPTQAEVDAAQGMSEGDRAAMIKGMVERLAQKLEANPHNLDGWVQLMRARIVMGDMDGAKLDLKRSLDAFNDSLPDRERLRSAAMELGMTP